jgi:hypothetical protein
MNDVSMSRTAASTFANFLTIGATAALNSFVDELIARGALVGSGLHFSILTNTDVPIV